MRREGREDRKESWERVLYLAPACAGFLNHGVPGCGVLFYQLIAAERSQWVYFSRPPGGYDAGRERHEEQQRRDTHERQRIGCAYAEQQTLNQSRYRHRSA